MFDLTSYLETTRTAINTALEDLIRQSASPNRIESAMSYSLLAGGKRLRPILCVAASEAVGGTQQEVLNTACALEMIHTYSLIHDDLPAMDNDTMRRGIPTCHVAFDHATAILAGDALLTYAFEILAQIEPGASDASGKLLHKLQVIQKIARAAGYKGMIQGQMLDIAGEGQALNQDALENIHRLKTGALIDASIATGALLGGASVEQMDLLSDYARNIGLAFQVVDDILNVEGDPELLGKAVGTDDSRDKVTYPALLGLEKSKAFAQKLVDQALHSLANFDNRSEPLLAIARYIIYRNR